MPGPVLGRHVSGDHLLTTRAASAKIAVSPRTMEGWRLAGDGPRWVVVGQRCVRYRASDLDSWIAAQPAVGGEK